MLQLLLGKLARLCLVFLITFVGGIAAFEFNWFFTFVDSDIHTLHTGSGWFDKFLNEGRARLIVKVFPYAGLLFMALIILHWRRVLDAKNLFPPADPKKQDAADHLLRERQQAKTAHLEDCARQANLRIYGTEKHPGEEGFFSPPEHVARRRAEALAQKEKSDAFWERKKANLQRRRAEEAKAKEEAKLAAEKEA